MSDFCAFLKASLLLSILCIWFCSGISLRIYCRTSDIFLVYWLLFHSTACLCPWSVLSFSTHELSVVIRFLVILAPLYMSMLMALFFRVRNLNIQNEIIQHIYRTITLCCSASFSTESALSNFYAHLQYGNRSSIVKHLATVAKATTKEIKDSMSSPLFAGSLAFVPNYTSPCWEFWW